MKLRLFLLILIVGLAALLNAASISGQVLTQEGTALAECQITLHGIGDNPMEPPHGPGGDVEDYVVFSDAQGNFIISDVLIGSYTLKADKEGFIAQPVGEPNGALRVIEIDADDQEVEGINIIMIRVNGPHGDMGSVSGIVRGADNQPISGIMVGVAFAAEPDNLVPFHFTVSRLDGHYMIGGLEINQNYVVYAVNNFNMTPISVPVPFSLTTAEPMAVGIDIITNFQAYSISGTVFNTTGEPIPNSRVVLRNIEANPNGVFLSIGTFTDAEGHYTLHNVIPGSYKVAMVNHFWMPVFYPSTTDPEAAGIVTVVDTDVADINITLPVFQTYTISGYVTDAATSLPLASIQVRIDRPGMNHHHENDLNPGETCPHDSLNSPDYITHTVTDETGYWSLAVPAGDYVLVAVDPTHTYRAQFYLNASTPFEATHVVVSADIENLNFALLLHEPALSYNISGLITENGVAPTYPVMVVAVSSDEDWEDATMTDPTGAYTLHHVRPGDYYVFACAPSAPPTYYVNAITWEDADLVTVNGNVVGIDIQLNYTPLNGPSTMNGTVSSLDGTPLPNVTVALQDDQNNVISFATTDANGQYSILQLADQNYTATLTILNVPTLVTQVIVSGNVTRDFTLNAPTGTDDPTEVVPSQSVSLRNYPNPFNPVTTIAFNVPKASLVTAEVYNLKGQKVKTLVQDFLPTGLQQLSWNGTNDMGNTVSSGIYFCKVKGDSFNSTHKMVMLK